MYVRVRVNEDLWNAFTGVTKFRRGDVSREFDRALRLYMGGVDNTLAIREYFRGMETLKEVINVRYDLFDGDFEFLTNARVYPVDPRGGFSEVAVKAIIEECLKRGELKYCVDDYRWKKVELPKTVDEMVKKVLDKHTLVFEVDIEGRTMEALVSREIFRFASGL